LSPHVAQVTLKHALTSYADVAGARDYRWPLSALLPGVLTRFDLPDCYRELKNKNLRIVEPWGADPKA
jgi:hypothetical protein